uniref:Uncharacterized protein n=1 Tax=Oryza sativa subsp. japonica TaxID=39947 RepID=Q6YWF0_ORYSJ|nr:hypothetical protein [Oryza sativa Japonica Group]
MPPHTTTPPPLALPWRAASAGCPFYLHGVGEGDEVEDVAAGLGEPRRGGDGHATDARPSEAAAVAAVWLAKAEAAVGDGGADGEPALEGWRDDDGRCGGGGGGREEAAGVGVQEAATRGGGAPRGAAAAASVEGEVSVAARVPSGLATLCRAPAI